jgi:glutathione S-transferase
MSVVLYHHPWSRAASAVWMLEEVGVPYELRFVDILAGEQSSEAHRALNSMGKIPVVVDGEATISEAAAIGVYLADRYAPGRLAPALDDPARGAFLRWAFFAPSVVEPGCMAHTSGWEFKPGSAGFGSYENLLATLSAGVTPGPWLLGERFTMADVILGSTLRWMLGFGMIEKRPEFVAYADRLGERPALKAADAKNAAIIAERNIGR